MGEVVGLFCTVVARGAAGAQGLAGEVGVGPRRARRRAGAALWAVMSGWANTSP